jgi:Fis family transcriptional regulator
MQLIIDIQSLINARENNMNGDKGAYRVLVEQIERPFFKDLLIHTDGNKSQAARVAGINRRTLNDKLKLYGLGVKKEVHYL